MALCPHGYTAFWDCPICLEPMGTADVDVARIRAIPSRFYNIGRRLTRGQALRRVAEADRRAGFGDFRGFTYNPKTGMAAVT